MPEGGRRKCDRQRQHRGVVIPARPPTDALAVEVRVLLVEQRVELHLALLLEADPPAGGPDRVDDHRGRRADHLAAVP